MHVHIYVYFVLCSTATFMYIFIGLPDSPVPDSGESDFLDSKRPELPKMEQNGRLECREPDSPESGKPMNMYV